MDNFDYIKNNYESLMGEIDALSSRLGTKAPTLVSVTKSGSDDELLALASFGAIDIGENRPGEVMRRGELLRAAGYSPRMHEIGTLQRNKIKLIADSVYMIHSVDSLALAKDINRHAEARGRVIPILIEVNSAKEDQKSGVFPEDTERFLYEISDFKNIKISGLMTMGPVSENPEELRPYFRETKALFDKLGSSYGFGEGATLSMGMSDSYRVAIEEGSTLVRVGRRLFRK
jgi:pyridoxal phosphate enzyme (YggS family)